jgi:hypothetical protein
MVKGKGRRTYNTMVKGKGRRTYNTMVKGRWTNNDLQNTIYI